MTAGKTHTTTGQESRTCQADEWEGLQIHTVNTMTGQRKHDLEERFPVKYQ